MEKTVFTREYTILKNLLREVRERQGMTQVDLAEKLRETQSFISKCERGERRLDLIQLRAFCVAIGIKPLDFFQEFEQRLASRKT
jgi:transcriptional regulator with XRE-family HTH domain